MSAQLAIDFAAARDARDAGMTQALQRAERIDDEWPELAYGFLVRFAYQNATFCGWQCTDLANAMGFGSPADDRAWGPIYKRAIKAGVIEQSGAGKNPHRHLSICPKYRSLVFAGVPA